MRTLPALFAMRTSIAAILVVAAVGLILGGIGRVVSDTIAWYKDQMVDPYRDLRKESKAKRKPRRTLEEIVNSTDVNRQRSSTDDDNSRDKPSDSAHV